MFFSEADAKRVFKAEMKDLLKVMRLNHEKAVEEAEVRILERLTDSANKLISERVDHFWNGVEPTMERRIDKHIGNKAEYITHRINEVKREMKEHYNSFVKDVVEKATEAVTTDQEVISNLVAQLNKLQLTKGD